MNPHRPSGSLLAPALIVTTCILGYIAVVVGVWVLQALGFSPL